MVVNVFLVDDVLRAADPAVVINSVRVRPTVMIHLQQAPDLSISCSALQNKALCVLANPMDYRGA